MKSLVFSLVLFVINAWEMTQTDGTWHWVFMAGAIATVFLTWLTWREMQDD